MELSSAPKEPKSVEAPNLVTERKAVDDASTKRYNRNLDDRFARRKSRRMTRRMSRKEKHHSIEHSYHYSEEETAHMLGGHLVDGLHNYVHYILAWMGIWLLIGIISIATPNWRLLKDSDYNNVPVDRWGLYSQRINGTIIDYGSINDLHPDITTAKDLTLGFGISAMILCALALRSAILDELDFMDCFNCFDMAPDTQATSFLFSGLFMLAAIISWASAFPNESFDHGYWGDSFILATLSAVCLTIGGLLSFVSITDYPYPKIIQEFLEQPIPDKEILRSKRELLVLLTSSILFISFIIIGISTSSWKSANNSINEQKQNSIGLSYLVLNDTSALFKSTNDRWDLHVDIDIQDASTWSLTLCIFAICFGIIGLRSGILHLFDYIDYNFITENNINIDLDKYKAHITSVGLLLSGIFSLLAIIIYDVLCRNESYPLSDPYYYNDDGNIIGDKHYYLLWHWGYSFNLTVSAGVFLTFIGFFTFFSVGLLHRRCLYDRAARPKILHYLIPESIENYIKRIPCPQKGITTHHNFIKGIWTLIIAIILLLSIICLSTLNWKHSNDQKNHYGLIEANINGELEYIFSPNWQYNTNIVTASGAALFCVIVGIISIFLSFIASIGVLNGGRGWYQTLSWCGSCFSGTSFLLASIVYSAIWVDLTYYSHGFSFITITIIGCLAIFASCALHPVQSTSVRAFSDGIVIAEDKDHIVDIPTVLEEREINKEKKRRELEKKKRLARLKKEIKENHLINDINQEDHHYHPKKNIINIKLNLKMMMIQ